MITIIDNKKYSTDRIMDLTHNLKDIICDQGNVIYNKFAPKYKNLPKLEFCQFLYLLAKNNFVYVLDHVDLQKITLPFPMTYILKGDCKAYAIFCYSILKAKGYPNVYLNYVSYDSDPQPSHVYCTTGNIIVDPTIDKFNFEPKYTYKYLVG